MKDSLATDKLTEKQFTGSEAAATLRTGLSWFITVSFFFVPLAIHPGLADSYTLPKVILIRFIIGISIILWLARLVVSRRVKWVKTPLDIPIAILMASAFVSTLFSTDRLLSLFGNYKRYEDLFTLVGYGLLYFVVTNNFRAGEIRRTVTAALAAAGLISIYGIAQYLGFDFIKTSASPERATSTLGNAVFLGTYLAFFLVIAVGRFAESKLRSIKRLAYLALIAALAAGLVLSFSRAAWVGLSLGLLVLAVIPVAEIIQQKRVRAASADKEKRRMSGRWLLVAVAAIVLIFISANLFRAPGISARYSVADRALSVLDTNDATVKTRLILWRSTFDLALKKPLFGYGPDTLIRVYPQYLPDDYKKIEPQARIDKAHNELINIFATLGFLGLAAFLAIVLLSCNVFRTRFTPGGSPDSAALFAAVIAYLAAVQFSFSQVETAIFLWLGLGLAMVSLGAVRQVELVQLEYRPARMIAWSVIALVGLAATIILTVFSIQPAIADYHFQRGLRAERQGQVKEARTQLALAADISGVRSLYYFRLGRRLQLDATAGARPKPKLVKRALRAYANAESLDQDNANIYTGLGSLYTSLSRTDARFADLAKVAYERSLSLNKYVPETYVDIGVLEAMEGNYETASANFKKALQLDPRNRAARDNLRSLRNYR